MPFQFFPDPQTPPKGSADSFRGRQLERTLLWTPAPPPPGTQSAFHAKLPLMSLGSPSPCLPRTWLSVGLPLGALSFQRGLITTETDAVAPCAPPSYIKPQDACLHFQSLTLPHGHADTAPYSWPQTPQHGRALSLHCSLPQAPLQAAYSKCTWGPAALVSLESLLEVRIHGLYFRPTGSESLG